MNDETPILKRYVVFFWAVQTVDIWKPIERIVVFFFLRTFEGPLTICFSYIYRYHKTIVNVHAFLSIYGQVMENQIFERFLSPLNQFCWVH